tara:strand:- start:470 stop:619 length:150 start_codon:yes stop_codon:yes gene_type:complete
MKLYNKKDGKLRQYHKKLIRSFQDKTNISDYGLIWLSFGKGLLIGLILL